MGHVTLCQHRCPIDCNPPTPTKPLRIEEGTVTRVAVGDTITVTTANQTKLRIRMIGIDAPETPKGAKFPGQPYGKEAEAHLKHLIGGKRVTVEIYGVDSHHRLLATVFLDGKDINLAMIEAGLAEIYRGPASDNPYTRQYHTAEDTARSAKKNMWIQGHAYESPRAYRKRVGISRRHVGQQALQRERACVNPRPDQHPITPHTSIRMDARLDAMTRAKLDDLATRFHQPRAAVLCHIMQWGISQGQTETLDGGEAEGPVRHLHLFVDTELYARVEQAATAAGVKIAPWLRHMVRQLTTADFPVSWLEERSGERSHDSRTYGERYMLRLDASSQTKLQQLVKQCGVSTAEIIRQLISQAKLEDFRGAGICRQ